MPTASSTIPTLQDLQTAMKDVAEEPNSLALYNICQRFAQDYEEKSIPWKPQKFWRDMGDCTEHGISTVESETRLIDLLPRRLRVEWEWVGLTLQQFPREHLPDIEQHIVLASHFIPLSFHVSRCDLHDEAEGLIYQCRRRNMLHAIHHLLNGLIDSTFDYPPMIESKLHDVLAEDDVLIKFLDQHWDINHIPKWCGQLAQAQGEHPSNWARSMGFENLATQLSKQEMLREIEVPNKGKTSRVM